MQKSWISRCLKYKQVVLIHLFSWCPPLQPHQTISQIFHCRITGRNLGITGRYKIFIALVIIEVLIRRRVKNTDADMGGLQGFIIQHHGLCRSGYLLLNRTRRKKNKKQGSSNEAGKTADPDYHLRFIYLTLQGLKLCQLGSNEWSAAWI